MSKIIKITESQLKRLLSEQDDMLSARGDDGGGCRRQPPVPRRPLHCKAVGGPVARARILCQGGGFGAADRRPGRLCAARTGKADRCALMAISVQDCTVPL